MSQLAQTRPNSPNAKHDHPYAGQVFTLGTRNSKLAMVQTETVRRELQEKWPGCEIRILGMVRKLTNSLSLFFNKVRTRN